VSGDTLRAEPLAGHGLVFATETMEEITA
jgi:hypothetical protein